MVEDVPVIGFASVTQWSNVEGQTSMVAGA
jgi:hypothetical protein